MLLFHIGISIDKNHADFLIPSKIYKVLATNCTLQTRSLYRLQGSPCVVILPCKDPVKITGYHSNPSSSVVGT